MRMRVCALNNLRIDISVHILHPDKTAVMSPQDFSTPSNKDLLSVARRSSSKSSSGLSRLQAISDRLNSGNVNVNATVKDVDLKEDFQPHILHTDHVPVPMALVNRPPRGRAYIHASVCGEGCDARADNTQVQGTTVCDVHLKMLPGCLVSNTLRNPYLCKTCFQLPL